MSKLFFAVTLKRAAGLIAGAGLGVFAAVFLILAGLMPGAVPALAATLPDAVLTAIAAAVPGDPLPAARTFTAWIFGFCTMEQAGAFRLGGDVDEAFEFGLDALLGAIGVRRG